MHAPHRTSAILRLGLLAALLVGCEASDVYCERAPQTLAILYSKADFIDAWDYQLEVIEDESGRLDPGPIGSSERVVVTFLGESVLAVLSLDAGLRAMFRVDRHVDGYRDGAGVCVARAPDDGALEWWQRGLFRADWSTELLAVHPALASAEERAVLRLEGVAAFVGTRDEPPRFERNPASSALVRFSLPVDYFVSETDCAGGCAGTLLSVRHVFTAPAR